MCPVASLVRPDDDRPEGDGGMTFAPLDWQVERPGSCPGVDLGKRRHSQPPEPAAGRP